MRRATASGSFDVESALRKHAQRFAATHRMSVKAVKRLREEQFNTGTHDDLDRARRAHGVRTRSTDRGGRRGGEGTPGVVRLSNRRCWGVEK